MSFIVKFCVTRHQFHVFQTFLQTLKAKKGFVASDFHLFQEPRIFNCFHFLFHLIKLDSIYYFQVKKMTHMQL